MERHKNRPTFCKTWTPSPNFCIKSRCLNFSEFVVFENTYFCANACGNVSKKYVFLCLPLVEQFLFIYKHISMLCYIPGICLVTAGVTSIVTAHLASIILNWREDSLILRYLHYIYIYIFIHFSLSIIILEVKLVIKIPKLKWISQM